MIRLIARFTVLLALLITIVVPLSAARAQDGTPEADASASPVAIEVPAPGESATVDKILANGKLRVGVAVTPPWLLQDPNTREYYGPAADLMQRIGDELGVPVEYVESGWDVLIAGLQAFIFAMLSGIYIGFAVQSDH